MTTRYRYFVILATMRTGSNLLEQIIAGLPGIHCHGEAFNPNFIEGPRKQQALGWTIPERDADPRGFLDAMIEFGGNRLSGFRLFDGHSPIVQARVLRDPACARIVLRRDPLDSFVSLKIAQETDQWMLRNPRRRQTARIRFVASEFGAYRRRHIQHYDQIEAGLRRSGLPALELDYNDLNDPDLPGRLAAYLGLPDGPVTAPDLVRQNPGGLRGKVINYGEMCAQLGLMPEPLDHEPLPGPGDFQVPANLPVALAPVAGPGYLPALAVLHRLEQRTGGATPLGRGAFMAHALRGDLFPTGPGTGRPTAVLTGNPADRLLWLWHREMRGSDGPAIPHLRARHPALPTAAEWPNWPIERRRAVFSDFLDLVADALLNRGDLACPAAWRPQAHLLRSLQFSGEDHQVFAADDLETFAAQICNQCSVEPIPRGQLRSLAAHDLPGFAADDTLDTALTERARSIHSDDLNDLPPIQTRPD